jgi:hypothetical protein
LVKTTIKPLPAKETVNYLVVSKRGRPPGGGGQMADKRKYCEALTSTGRQCRSKGVLYRIYEGDRQEYLSCKLHYKYFKPHPGPARERQQVKG